MTLFERDLSSFGALLKAFRTCRHLTQQQLADAVGVHRHTISRWEQGDFLPQQKAQVLELAKHLHLDNQQTRQLLEASLTALAPYFLVPLPRNPLFTGREEILAALCTQLGGDQAAALTQSLALHGLGGVGKTQIALEYAYRYALEYSAIFWIEAKQNEQIVASLLRIAEILQLPGRNEKDQQRVVAAVQNWLSSHRQWLLIWDDVEDLDVLHRFLPSTRSGAILITTRRQALGTLTRDLALSPMEQEEGILFLLRRAKILDTEISGEHMRQFARQMPAQYAAAVELVEMLGGLPLALDQAGAYLEETHCGLLAYLDLFRTRRATLLQQRGVGSYDHPASVSTTFTLAITAITQRHTAARDLLQISALLQPDAIPEELFRQGGEHLGPALEAVCCDPLAWDRVVGMACSYSLLSRQPEGHTLSMHRLVQAVLLDMMMEAEQEQWNKRAINALDTMFPEVLPITEYAVWRQCERLLPHALLCLCRAGASEESFVFASLAYKVAQYLQVRGQYTQAELLYQRALSIQERMLGTDHPEVISSLYYLALLYCEQGKYTHAEPLFQRALHIGKQVLEPNYPEIAHVLNGLGLVYRAQNKLMQAESFYQQALLIWEQVLGPEHPEIAISLNHLAELFFRESKYAQSAALHQRAQSIRERVLGSDHPEVAASLHNLANLYRDQGAYEQAEPLYQRAHAIREQGYGQVHPETAQTLHDLATFRQKQGKLSEALSFAERALSIRFQALGDTHPKTVATRKLYAQLVLERQRTTEETAVEQGAKGIPDVCYEERQVDRVSLFLHKEGDLSASDNDPLQGFLDACCELSPRAWCRISDLWQAYEQWTVSVQQCVPLARRAFAAQIKARGCRPDRTSKVRIWRGIRLRDKW